MMIDETTDISVTSQMVIYYRYAGKNSKPNIVLAGLESLPNGDVDTLMRAACFRLEKDRIDPKQIVCFGSDGATVMLGIHNGVSTPNCFGKTLTSLHFIACATETLACEAAAGEIDYLKLTFFLTIEQLGRFYENSHARTAWLR
eukprot:Pompholyxophrys_punicea_v1_NODE_423_length_2000_cov_3.273008.p1 type:complete len:144 gc:universal NODE_423_length_2000_cov_3.273008:1115-684(-)